MTADRAIALAQVPAQGNPHWWTADAKRAIQRIPKFRRGAPTFIYVAEIVGFEFCKVGISQDIQVRLKNLQTSMPFPIKIARCFGPWPKNEALIIEGMAHLALQSARVQGEWFRASPSSIFTVISDASRIARDERLCEARP